jgi:hypothetical protein
MNGHHLKQYIQERKNRDEATWQTVDMRPFGTHLKGLRSSQQNTHVEVVHDQLPLGIRRYQHYQSRDDTLKFCPCFATADKTNQHFLHCKDNTFMTTRILAFFRSCKGGSHPLHRLLVHGITHWIDTGKLNFQLPLGGYPVHLTDTLALLFAEKEQTGWKNALKGLLGNDFRPMILSCQHVLVNDRTFDIAKTNLGTRHSFLPVFVLNHHVSIVFFRHLVCRYLHVRRHP